ncbi:hypothetical protein HDU76_004020 [Blyttiomyces sp. JEL0837]|nr:hypothetical protein HDU76_004020 [Blyttiomyces sp. JEL0837]
MDGDEPFPFQNYTDEDGVPMPSFENEKPSLDLGTILKAQRITLKVKDSAVHLHDVENYADVESHNAESQNSIISKILNVIAIAFSTFKTTAINLVIINTITFLKETIAFALNFHGHAGHFWVEPFWRISCPTTGEMTTSKKGIQVHADNVMRMA